MTNYFLAAAVALSGFSFAAFADEEHSGSTTVDKKTETTKEMKDGKVEKSTTTETDSQSN